MDFTKLSLDKFLNGAIEVYQPKGGYKSGTDAILLASLINQPSSKLKNNVLEIGCGVGVASLALANRLKDLKVVGIEKNDYLYDICKLNIDYNKHIDNFIAHNFNILDKSDEKLKYFNNFNYVIMNPPYFKNNVEIFTLKNKGNLEEDARLNDFINFAFYALKNNGKLMMIYTSSRFQEVLNLLSTKHWGNIIIHPVYSTQNKPATRFLLEATKLSRGPSILSSGIIMHNDDKTHSKKANDILKNGLSFY